DSRTIAQNVPNLVHPDILQTEARELPSQDLTARRFLERRRRHFAKPDLILDRLGLIRPHPIERRPHGRLSSKRRDESGLLSRQRLSDHYERQGNHVRYPPSVRPDLSYGRT